MPGFQSSSIANPIGRSSAFDFGTKEVSSVKTYSVGTNVPNEDRITRPHDGSDVTIQIKDSIVTFSYPQSYSYIGVGDKIEWFGSLTPVYLNRKISTTQWEVHNGILPVEDVAADETDQSKWPALISIKKVYSSLQEAITNLQDTSPGVSLFGSLNLVEHNSILRIATYYIYPLDVTTSTITISDSWITNEDCYIRIFAPSDVKTECNISNKHLGMVIGTICYLIQTQGSHTCFDIKSDYCEIEGLYIKGNNNNVLINYGKTGLKKTKVLRNILEAASTCISATAVPGDNQVVVGNVIANGVNAISMANKKINAYNNSIYNFSGYGFRLTVDTNDASILNNIAQKCVSGCYSITGTLGNTINYCVDDDNTLPNIANNYRGNVNRIFKETVDVIDLHLDSRALDDVVRSGINLSEDSYYDFDTDCDNRIIDNTWPIGAFHYTRLLPIAVGDPKTTDLKTSTPTASVTDGVLTFSIAQDDPRICVGCLVTINTVTDPVVLLYKISSTKWIVTQIGSNAGKSYFSIPSNSVTSIKVTYKDLYEVLVDDGSGYPGLYTKNVNSYDFTDPSKDIKPEIYCTFGSSEKSINISENFIFDESRRLLVTTSSNAKHQGVWDSNKWFCIDDSVLNTISINTGYVTIKDLQITSQTEYSNAIFVNMNGENIHIIGNIIKNANVNGIFFDTERSHVLSVIDSNLIYDCVESGINISRKFLVRNANYAIYHNTIIGGKFGIKVEMSNIVDFTNNINLKNNLVNKSTIRSYEIIGLRPLLTQINSCWSDDEIPFKFTGRNNIGYVNVHFLDPAKKDYRLCLSDSVLMSDSDDISVDTLYPYGSPTFTITNRALVYVGFIVYDYTVEGILNFSVGDYSNNNPQGVTISISSKSILTFSDDSIINNIGIGDVIVYGNSNLKCYISEKGDSKTWGVRRIDGTRIGYTPTTSLKSFSRAYPSLSNAVDNIKLIQSDLVADSKKINIWCYKDIVDTLNVNITGYTCNSDYKIKILSPYDSKTQCNINQRHRGIWTDAYTLAPASGSAITVGTGIVVDIVGLQIKGNINDWSDVTDGILFTSNNSETTIINNIIKYCSNGLNGNKSSHIFNNIVYECSTGIYSEVGEVSNNTVCKTTVHGIASGGAPGLSCLNNICQADTGNCFNNVNSIDNCLSSDNTADLFVNINLKFKNIDDRDFHLYRGDWQAINNGLSDVFNYTNFPFYDIDMSIVTDNVSIGADFYTGLVTRHLYFSVGKNTGDLKRTGLTIHQTISISGNIATFNFHQTNDNIGVGNVVTYNSTASKCYLTKKISPTQWYVSDEFGEPPEEIINSVINSIKHVYNDIQESVDISSGFPVLLGNVVNPFINLSASKYQVNIVVYKSELNFTNEVVINSYICDEENYLKIYSPYDLTCDCEQVQRHKGWDDPDETSSVKLKIEHNLLGEAAINIESEFVVVEGIIIDAGSDIALANKGIVVDQTPNVKILGCIIKNSYIGISHNSNDKIIIANNIIYNVVFYGIYSSGSSFMYNNTVVVGSHTAIYNSNSDVSINCITQALEIGGHCFNSNLNNYYCLSSDNSAGSNHSINNTSLIFEDIGNENFNLSSIDNDDDVALRSGLQLEDDIEFGFNVDSKGFKRNYEWSLGANDVEPKKIFFAVSNYTGLDVSTRNSFGGLQFTINNSRIIFEVGQTNENIGVGFEVIPQGTLFTNGCFIKEKINHYEWLVCDRYGNPVSDTQLTQVYRIKPVFESLYQAQNIEQDLILNKIQVNIVCYKGSDTDKCSLIISNINSNKKYYLKIYTPIDTLREVNSSQRHDGVINTGYRIVNNVESIPAIKIVSANYTELTGICVESNNNGIVFTSCNSCYIYKNIVVARINGIEISYYVDYSKYYVINNLIYDCGGDGIRAGSSYELVGQFSRIFNNTIINCKRGVNFTCSKINNGVEDLILCNVIQDSLYRDCVISYFNIGGNVNSGNYNLTSDESSDFNYKHLIFANKENKNFFLNRYDYSALNTGITFNVSDRNSIYTFVYFNDDIVSTPRNNGSWSMGAFENVDTVGTGELEVSTVLIEGSCTTLSEIPNLELHVRKYPVEENSVAGVLSTRQFDSIEGLPNSLNDFLEKNPAFRSYNLIINLQGGLVLDQYSGVINLSNRYPNLKVTVRTYPPELGEDIAIFFYKEYVVNEIVDKSTIVFENVKIFCLDPVSYRNYLISEDSATVPTDGSKILRFINCIVQLNYDAIAETNDENKNLITVESINSQFIYRNEFSNTNLYLIRGKVSGSVKLLNSMILTYLNSSNVNFKTSHIQTNDEVNNVLTYNYDGVHLLSIDVGNIKNKCIENTNPIFSTSNITTQLFDTVVLAKMDFKPELNSPVFDSGNNDYVVGIPYDIAGNTRIFNRMVVDIGAYELQAHVLNFKSNDISSVYQDKLTLSSGENLFRSSDKIFSDLYDDFYDNENYRLDFSRESKIIILLKFDESEFNVFNDKEMVLVNDFEAFYDNENLAIVVTKNQNLFGDLFNIMFNDGRYVFRFNQIEHKLSVYLVDTYNKGSSGDKNLINNVRFGGAPVLTN